jgi:type IV secretory pathway TraG/TraD family ATPase VirD4
MAALERMVPPGKKRMALQVFLDQYRKRTKEGVVIDTERIKQMLGGMVGRMSQFAQDKFGAVFNTYTPEIDLTDIIVNNKMLYVMLPTMGKDVAALNLGKMILSDLRTAVYRVQSMPVYQRPNPPFLVFADEMGSYVMPGIARVFEQARSARICMIPAFQSFANLATVSPDFEDIIIQNTWSKVIFKFGAIDSPEKAAELIGKQMRYTHSVSSSKSTGDSASAIRTTPQASKSENASSGESWREEEVHRVTPDQLRALGIGEAVAVVGPRMYHLRMPRLEFPSPLPLFRPLRHPQKMPAGIQGLDYESRYREFLVADPEAGMTPVGAI